MDELNRRRSDTHGLAKSLKTPLHLINSQLSDLTMESKRTHQPRSVVLMLWRRSWAATLEANKAKQLGYL